MMHKLLSGRHSRIEGGGKKTYVRDDLIDLTPAEVESFGPRVQPVYGAPPVVLEGDSITPRRGRPRRDREEGGA